MGQAVAFSNRFPRVGVLVADGVALDRQLITLALQRDKKLEILDAGKASILEAVRRLRPQVVLLSEHATDTARDGLETLKKLREAAPESRVIMLLDEQERRLVVDSFRFGARGVFCRCQDAKMLARCVHNVHEGQFWVSSCQIQFLLEALSNAPAISIVDARGSELLSLREQEVVRWMANGLSNREIAHQMRISENTVKNYVYRIFNKLGMSNRVEVVMYATSQRPNLPPRRIPSGRQPPFTVSAAAGED
jgi:DNA-binding NarL/FixJ family response regulator